MSIVGDMARFVVGSAQHTVYNHTHTTAELIQRHAELKAMWEASNTRLGECERALENEIKRLVDTPAGIVNSTHAQAHLKALREAKDAAKRENDAIWFEYYDIGIRLGLH